MSLWILLAKVDLIYFFVPDKKSADSLERRSKRLTTRRQSSKDLGLAGVDQIKAQASLQKQDSKDYG